MLNLLTDLTTWVEGFYNSQYAALVLGIIALAESIFSPIIPDIFLISISILKPETAIWLKENNIFYAPDYLVNSGGVIAISCEINNSEDILEDQLNKISDKVLSLLKESQKSILSTDKIAEDLAWKRINS